jgi:hypothetical protein
MDRRLFAGLITLGLFFSNPVKAVMAVLDTASIAKMGEVLGVAKNSLDTMNSVKGELSLLNAVMGNPLGDRLSSLTERTGVLNDTGGLIDQLLSPGGDSFSAFNNFNVMRGGQDRSNLLYLKSYAQEKLYLIKPAVATSTQSPFGSQYQAQPITAELQQQVLETRQNLLIDTSSTGIALAEEQKKMSSETQKSLEKLHHQSARDKNMMDLLRTQTQYMELLVNAINTTNILLGQLVQIQSAQVASSTPVIFKGKAMLGSRR